jgi:uncharacterized protein YutE (UPF0331/DUF86 family)
MPDNVIVAKAAIIERCVQRARAELAASADFDADYTRQDAAILNVERACEAAIDIANRIIRTRGLGVQSSNRDAFDKLRDEGVIEDALRGKLKNMVGFRNIAVHRYHELDTAIVRAVIEKNLDDLLEFSAVALRLPI